MTRTPDEIKKGLECCNEWCNVESCPYWEDSDCTNNVRNDGLALIQQLQAENAEKDARIHQLEAERDAAVADIKQMVLDPYEPCFCDYCKLTEEECARSNCKGRSAFVWRGVQKD